MTDAARKRLHGHTREENLSFGGYAPGPVMFKEQRFETADIKNRRLKIAAP
jgi:hypothetical protein